MLTKKNINSFIRVFLISWSILISIYHLNIGIADNGDWGRTILWFSDKPQGFSEFWPSDHFEYEKRFFNYWLPNWEFNFQFGEIFSSSLFIWLPGAFLNYLFYSSTTMFLPLVSIIPRFLLIFLLYRFLIFIENKTRNPLLFYLICGIPFTFLISTTDYLIFLNSFYQEIGTLIYLLSLFIISLGIFSSENLSKIKIISLYFLLTLLALAKPNNFYWPIFYTFILLFAGYKIKGKYSNFSIVVLIIFVIISSIASVTISRLPSSMSYTKYHTIFYGALTFSDHPEDHLEKLGYDQDAISCIGISGFHDQICFEKYKNNTSLSQLIQIYISEPGVFLNSLVYTASNMQNLRLDYLGNYQRGDQTQYRKNKLNLWSEIKKLVFPKGLFLLLLTITIITVLAFFVKKEKTNPRNTFCYLTIMFLSACVLDMIIAIIGDGRQELTKHLFAANLCFDLGTISFLGFILSEILENQPFINYFMINKFVKGEKK